MPTTTTVSARVSAERRRRAGLVGAAVLLVFGAVRGASAQADDVFAELPGADAPPAAEDTASAEQRAARVRAVLGSIERASQAVQRELQLAREARDVVRVLCLSDKLGQIDVALTSAEDRATALRTALARGDAERVRHEQTVLDVLDDRVRVLLAESNQCVGEETGFIGDADISVTVDPNLPAGTLANEYTPPLAPPPTVNSPIE